jgi:hypothetical protein
MCHYFDYQDNMIFPRQILSTPQEFKVPLEYGKVLLEVVDLGLDVGRSRPQVDALVHDAVPDLGQFAEKVGEFETVLDAHCRCSSM